MTEYEKVKRYFEKELSMIPEESMDSVECEEIKEICLKAIVENLQNRKKEYADVEKDDTVRQFEIFEFLQREVKLVNACEYKNGELHEYSIDTTYSDIVLLISMLHEYIEMLKKLTGSVVVEYYQKKFSEITKYLEEGIKYNYQEKLEKCRKKEKEKDERLGENWIGA